MTAAKQYRWKCARCARAVLAPGRMAADDVRRFCLPCSKETGKLVQRASSTLDRERAKKAESAAAKRARVAKAERERAAKVRAREQRNVTLAAEGHAAAERALYDLGGRDLREIAAEIWKLPALVERHGGRKLPRVEVKRWDRTRRSLAYGYKIRLNFARGSWQSVNDGTETILHELVHCAVGTSHKHDAFFWTTLRAGARELWPDVEFEWHKSPARGYAVDWWIRSHVSGDPSTSLDATLVEHGQKAASA